jgi:hypothetical protein
MKAVGRRQESEIEKGDPVNILRFQPIVPTQVALQSPQAS